MTLAASSVRLYANEAGDYQNAIAAAALAGIPISNVVGNFETIWSDIASGDYLVIAVGGQANTALYYNSPFAHKIWQRTQLPQ